MMTIDAAAPPDLEPVSALLDRSHLPLDGLRECLPALLVARADERIVGCAGLELYAGGALLRSVAVDERHRGEGLGQRLTEAALALARERGAAAAYLLTTTAPGFFPRFGFATINRADVPDDVKRSVEFTSACPLSAHVMRAQLRPRAA